MKWIGQITYDEVAYFREDVIIEAGNKLGIGTASPGQKLHVMGSGIFEETGNTNVELKLRPYSSALNDTYAWNLIASDQNSNYDFFIKNGNTDVFHINNKVQGNNNVGIGTASPARLLHVAGGDILIENNRGFYSKNTAGSSLSIFKFDTSNNAQIGSIFAGGGMINYANTNHIWYTYPSSVLTEQMRLTQAGNVGIGTSSPASLLHVAGTVQVGVDDTGHDVKFFGAYMLVNICCGMRVLLTDGAYAKYGTSSDNYSHTGSYGTWNW
jgi:hypothetical protein